MSTYATLTDLRAYAPVAADPGALNDAAAQRVLDHAERDVDAQLAVPAGTARQPSGLKYDPATLEAWKRAALSRAVCAQAEYRLVMGEEFFIKAQHENVRGPDFSTSGRLPEIGPKVDRELAGTGLQRPSSASARLRTLFSRTA